jgi:hypothetical protein
MTPVDEAMRQVLLAAFKAGWMERNGAYSGPTHDEAAHAYVARVFAAEVPPVDAWEPVDLGSLPTESWTACDIPASWPPPGHPHLKAYFDDRRIHPGMMGTALDAESTALLEQACANPEKPQTATIGGVAWVSVLSGDALHIGPAIPIPAGYQRVSVETIWSDDVVWDFTPGEE